MLSEDGFPKLSVKEHTEEQIASERIHCIRLPGKLKLTKKLSN